MPTGSGCTLLWQANVSEVSGDRYVIEGAGAHVVDDPLELQRVVHEAAAPAP